MGCWVGPGEGVVEMSDMRDVGGQEIVKTRLESFIDMGRLGK